MLIYKYVNYDVALKILENGLVKASFPSEFNDPFDSILDETNKVEDKCINLYLNYKISTMIYNDLKKYSSRWGKKDRILSKIYIKILDFYRYLMLKNDLYVPYPLLNKIIELSCKHRPYIQTEIDNFKKGAKTKIRNILRECRDTTVVACFSLRCDSTLMWSHYGDSHKGICIEFETRNELEPKKIKYSSKRKHLDLYYIFQRIFASEINTGIPPKLNKSLDKALTKPFFVKSKDWKYEKEVRFNLTKEDKKILNYQNGLYLMNPGLIKTIYIGCKCDGAKADQIEHIAREKGISIKHMKPDVDSFNMIVVD